MTLWLIATKWQGFKDNRRAQAEEQKIKSKKERQKVFNSGYLEINKTRTKKWNKYFVILKPRKCLDGQFDEIKNEENSSLNVLKP